LYQRWWLLLLLHWISLVRCLAMSVTSSTMHRAVRWGLLMEACGNALLVIFHSGVFAMMTGMHNKCKGLWCALMHKQILTWNAELDVMLYCCQCACCLDVMQGSTNWVQQPCTYSRGAAPLSWRHLSGKFKKEACQTQANSKQHCSRLACLDELNPSNAQGSHDICCALFWGQSTAHVSKILLRFFALASSPTVAKQALSWQTTKSWKLL